MYIYVSWSFLPVRSEQCQIWTSAIVLKVLCSINKESYFHCLYKKKTQTRITYVFYDNFKDSKHISHAIFTHKFVQYKRKYKHTTGNIISVGWQANKIFLIWMSFESSQTMRFIDIP